METKMVVEPLDRAFVMVPRERLRKLIEWHQREQDELTCSDLCDKTYEFQGCPSGTCALQDGKDELAWWAALASPTDEDELAAKP